MKRAAFKGCVQYVLGKDQAKLLSADGVLLGNTDNIIRSFNTQRLMKPNIKHPVGHISLSYSPDDEKRLTDGAMITLTKEYMQEMNIKDTQYIIVRHFDNGNPHVHLVYNRIDNNGRVISDKNDRYRNEAVCKKLKDKYGLTYGKGKDRVKQQKLRGTDKTKYQVYNDVKDVLSKSTNWNDFELLLKEKGVALSYKYKSNDPNIIQGISFTKDNITFKGSEVDLSFSYLKIDKLLDANAQTQNRNMVIGQSNEKDNSRSQETGIVGSLIEGLGSMSIFEPQGEDLEGNRFRHEMERRQKKINRKNNKRPGLN